MGTKQPERCSQLDLRRRSYPHRARPKQGSGWAPGLTRSKAPHPLAGLLDVRVRRICASGKLSQVKLIACLPVSPSSVTSRSDQFLLNARSSPSRTLPLCLLHGDALWDTDGAVRLTPTSICVYSQFSDNVLRGIRKHPAGSIASGPRERSRKPMQRT